MTMLEEDSIATQWTAIGDYRISKNAARSGYNGRRISGGLESQTRKSLKKSYDRLLVLILFETCKPHQADFTASRMQRVTSRSSLAKSGRELSTSGVKAKPKKPWKKPGFWL